jgi:hypothetical protein
MADISKCTGVDTTTKGICPKRETCYRFTAVSAGNSQSWLSHAPFDRYGQCLLYKPTSQKRAAR